jgi:hypothetical protein
MPSYGAIEVNFSWKNPVKLSPTLSTLLKYLSVALLIRVYRKTALLAGEDNIVNCGHFS